MNTSQSNEESMGEYFGEIYGRSPTLKFKEFRKNNGDRWMKQDGTILRIKAMETSHIKNCLRLLVATKETNTKAYRGLFEELKQRSER